MDEHIFDKVHEVDMQKTMENYYIDYAMSVIVSRALPDVRDGLKPVQRRILYSMIELNNGPDKPHRKCARIVGDTMGKYHPHGDSSIYEALVKLAQDFNTRYPLVDGHGNFGSVDGDSAAAMRYTEARLSKISMEMTADINKNTVDFTPNFDETEKEPVVLPSRYPNLLVNGTSGIAVGMATNIPPHNLKEVIEAVVKIIDNRIQEDRDTTLEEIMQIIKGPDFPTGGTIIGKMGINEAYRTGRGKIKVRAVTNIEPMANGKNRIVVTELPYMVNKAKLIQKIAELVRDKKIDGITDLRDESDRSGMRVCIELRRDVNPNIILNQLYKHTQLQDTFGVIMLALVDNQPKVLNLYDMLKFYLLHQEDVVTRRTKYDLNKAEERAHILEGLMIALDNIDRVIHIIRGSESVQLAKESLTSEFSLSDAQAQAIVDMRLRALTGLERAKLESELKELLSRIAEYKAILSDKNKLLSVIRTEISAIADKYGDERRTSIVLDILLALNITLSIIVIMITMFTTSVLQLSVFPTLLLVVTLFRLGLNISSTRLILSKGDAGSIITAFGDFVVGGTILVHILHYFYSFFHDKALLLFFIIFRNHCRFLLCVIFAAAHGSVYFLLYPGTIRADFILVVDRRISHDLAICTEIEPLAGILSPGILRHRPVGLKIVPVSSEHLPSGHHLSVRVEAEISGIDRIDRSDSLCSISEFISPASVVLNPLSCSLLLRSRCRAVSGRIAFLCIDILISVVQHFLCICIVGALGF